MMFTGCVRCGFSETPAPEAPPPQRPPPVGQRPPVAPHPGEQPNQHFEPPELLPQTNLAERFERAVNSESEEEDALLTPAKVAADAAAAHNAATNALKASKLCYC